MVCGICSLFWSERHTWCVVYAHMEPQMTAQRDLCATFEVPGFKIWDKNFQV